jgi:DNA-binding NtrC family response regulator
MQGRNVEKAGPATYPDKPAVLVVEDDVLQRMWICDVLRKAGFVVVEAADLEEAQTVLKSIPEIEAVFADIVLPRHGSATELVTWMADEAPDIPVVLTSGQTTLPQAINLTSCPNVTDFLPKPYDADAVQRLLHERIAMRGGRGSGASDHS